MRELHFVNPNGLHDPSIIPRRATWRSWPARCSSEFPDQPTCSTSARCNFGGKIIRNHNGLIGRYPGADGMKTGFTCPAGWNVVASAQQNGRKLIVVVLGSVSPRVRTNEAAMLFDRGFAMSGLGAEAGDAAGLGDTAPPDMRQAICHGRGRGRHAGDAGGFRRFRGGCGAGDLRGGRAGRRYADDVGAMEAPPHAASVADERVAFEPIKVFVGPLPGWTGPVLAARGGGADERGSLAGNRLFRRQGSQAGRRRQRAGGAEERREAARRGCGVARLTPEARARVAAAAQRVARKPQRHSQIVGRRSRERDAGLVSP